MSVLKALRSIMPSRVLSYGEGLQRAELQANRLLQLHHITQAPVPVEILTELPRITVTRRYDMPVSGSAHWNGSSWVITVNASEPEPRQCFSLFHEFKHILDHPFRNYVNGGDDAPQSERIADYFAGCVLMPRAWVKAAFFSKTQSVERLAAMFDVSPKAMSVRLAQLGLTEPAERCKRLTIARRPRVRRRTYFRTATPTRLLPAGVSP